MKRESQDLYILLVEDDRENLELLMDSLPKEVSGHNIEWEPCVDFEEAVRRVGLRRYDLIVTDIYRDRRGHRKEAVEDEKALDILNSIRNTRFCPVVAFTDGSVPQSFEEGAFVKFADKSTGNREIIGKLEELLATGIPVIARRLHDELDRAAGSYLWDFLEENWDDLEGGFPTPDILERLVRRRASIQIGRLDPGASLPTEVERIDGLEFYIYPPVSGAEIRLGQILQNKNKEDYRIVLTPHCHLALQQGENRPKADYVLVVQTVPAVDILRQYPVEGKTNERKLRSLARKTQSPADIGRPSGRYWFLPNFLNMPDRYCDFLQIESLPLDVIDSEYVRFAVLDTPFAEALQSCFTKFYSAVGLPSLQVNKLQHLIPTGDGG
ncbi:MAG: hypothetical protein OXR72_08475 [Gemmatimonadota bacterium]|nr:hypothetical protein [Gemmatimonadota bacterium]